MLVTFTKVVIDFLILALQTKLRSSPSPPAFAILATSPTNQPEHCVPELPTAVEGQVVH